MFLKEKDGRVGLSSVDESIIDEGFDLFLLSFVSFF